MSYLKRAKEFRTKKRLGQNFLVEGQIIDTIINNANLTKEDTIIEIGPGIGFVTEQLAQKVKKVIAFEIDYDAIDELAKMPYSNVDVIAQDILKVDFSEFTNEPVKVIANIPYYITSPILVHLLGEIDQIENKNRNCITEIILMVQYEVAKRIVADQNAKNKEYGTLSILCNYWAETQLIKKVPSKCFYPAPKVDSALVRLKVRKEPLVQPNNPTIFRKTVKAAFGVRRKNLRNSLSMGGFNKIAVTKALDSIKMDSIRRGETLSIQEFKLLSDALETAIKETSDAKTEIKTPAKINLTLEILRKREDGFHEIQSIMQAVDLYDTLNISVEDFKKGLNEINLCGNNNLIPYDNSNLVYKATEAFLNTAKIKNKKISIYIDKKIPVAAGLAGGSSNAAGTLKGLNFLFDNLLTDDELHKIASALGSDVNFCLVGGTQLASSRGEVLAPVTTPDLKIALIKPKNTFISAKEAYEKYSKLNNKTLIKNTSKLIEKLESQECSASQVASLINNDLETAIIENYPEIKNIKALLKKEGALNAMMSGSGPTVFAIYEKDIDLDNFAKTCDIFKTKTIQAISIG